MYWDGIIIKGAILKIKKIYKKEPPGKTGGSSYAGIALCSSRNTWTRNPILPTAKWIAIDTHSHFEPNTIRILSALFRIKWHLPIYITLLIAFYYALQYNCSATHAHMSASLFWLFVQLADRTYNLNRDFYSPP